MTAGDSDLFFPKMARAQIRMTFFYGQALLHPPHPLTQFESYPPTELNDCLQKFFAEIRNQKGEEYEPDSLKVMLAAMDRYLKEKNNSHSIVRDQEFFECKKVLEGKARQLRQ